MKKALILTLMLLGNVLVGEKLSSKAQDVPLTKAISARWSPDGRILAIGADNGLWFYYPTTGKIDFILSDVGGGVWTDDGKLFIGTAFLDPNTLQLEEFTDYSFDPNVGGIGYSKDFKQAAVRYGNYFENIAVYDTSNGDLIRQIKVDRGMTTDAAWSPDETQFALTLANGSLLIVSNSDNPVITEYPQNLFASRIVWSKDGRFLAIGLGQQTLRILDTKNKTYLGDLLGQVSYRIEWSPDGSRIAASDLDGSITIWDVSTSMVIEKYQTTSYLWNIDFSPFGATLALAMDTTSKPSIPIASSTANIDNTSVYIEPIQGVDAVQIVVPAPSPEKLESITQACGVQPIVEQSLTAQIDTNNLQAFTTQVSALTDTEIPPGCKADLLAVANALIAKAQQP
ncbi:MAG: WD40 repeat domain-containing protein [Chloroflexi bacterium]|nr:WD40 repeat domain-containing protein [Chloroflexota bacterium]MCC6893899.1 WD40 repeat domain-containing protein [Anaerolineae bacterium]